ncbi:MAG: ABC transporter ATP-binding protein [Magnetococcales bacterium]|nr:ABC transporter ATP-binding protein [Magnetococcales bacterium]
MIPDDSSPAVVIRQLGHCYRATRRQAPRKALDRLDLTIPTGTFFVLTGPNGSGKSTLFKILCGMTRPSTGTIHIFDHDLIANPNAARSAMGVVFQKPALDKYLTVEENLKIHADLHDIPPDLFRQRLPDALAWSDLRERLGDRVETLSGGLARQAELVKVLLHAPALLLLDEPTAGLDPGGRLAFLATLKRLQKKHGVTILMTSHVFAEAEQADLVAILRQGKLLALDSPTHLSRQLGAEILVVQGEGLETVAQGLTTRAGITLQVQNHELRIQGESRELLPLMAKLLQDHRERIHALAIKQPTLEDVYIHLTGRDLFSDEEEQNR